MSGVQLGAIGKIVTGFSKPYVAKYSASKGKITYSDGKQLARGVDVSIDPESSSGKNFHADNQVAESIPKKFTGGKLKLKVDGLLIESERMLFGLPQKGADGFTAFGDEMDVPYVGFGYIVRFMSGGIESFVPTVISKTKFDVPSNTASTQGDDIDWQTESLEASIYRGDDEKHNWKFLGEDYATEKEAEEALKKKLNITSTGI